jgi:hypothetical protein
MTEETQTQTAPTLGLTDLVTAAQIIQLATSRGAWKPEELSTVGNFYDRLIAFLESAGAVQRTPAPTDTTAPPETPAAPQETTNVKTRRKA